MLYIGDGVGRVGGGLDLGRFANQTPVFGEGDIGGCHAVAMVVDENLNVAILHHTDPRVGCAQVLYTVSL